MSKKTALALAIEGLPRWSPEQLEGCFEHPEGEHLDRDRVLDVVRRHSGTCVTCRHVFVRGRETGCRRPELEIFGWLPDGFGCTLYEAGPVR